MSNNFKEKKLQRLQVTIKAIGSDASLHCPLSQKQLYKMLSDKDMESKERASLYK